MRWLFPCHSLCSSDDLPAHFKFHNARFKSLHRRLVDILGGIESSGILDRQYDVAVKWRLRFDSNGLLEFGGWRVLDPILKVAGGMDNLMNAIQSVSIQTGIGIPCNAAKLSRGNQIFEAAAQFRRIARICRRLVG